MEDAERNYRETPISNKKHAKRLTEFISKLIGRGRNLEAHHYFLQLCKISPHHEKTIRLGYTIAIALFDNDGVSRFDRLLTDSSPDPEELLWFRIRYYHSVNRTDLCEKESCRLLETSSNKKFISTVIEICITHKNYVIAEALVRYLDKNHLNLLPPNDKWLKKIIITKLIENLRRRK